MRFQDVMIALIAVFFWSGNLIVQKAICQDFNLDFFNVLRFLCCVPALLFFKKPPNSVFKIMFIGLFWNVLPFFFMSLSLNSGTEAGIAAVIFQTCALFGILFSWLMVKEVPKKHQLIGMSISLCGVVLMGSHLFASKISILGLCFSLLGAASWGLGIGFIKKYNILYDFSFTIWLAGISLFPMLLIMLAKGGTPLIIQSSSEFTWPVVGAIIYAVVFATLIATYYWFQLIKKYDTASVSPFMMFLIPMSCLMSYAFLGEKMTFMQLTSCIIIFCGILVNQNIMGTKVVSFIKGDVWKKLTSTN